MILNNNPNKILFLIAFIGISIVAIIASNSLFLFDDNGNQNEEDSSSVWSDSDQITYMNECEALGNDSQTCDCMMTQFQDIYSSSALMKNEMRQNTESYSLQAISIKKSCLNQDQKDIVNWTKTDRVNWLRDCASLGRDEEKCKCILGQLEIIYPSKHKMNIEMKKNPTKFSQSMISAKQKCN
tara:strand:- start:670 stop:1218 length:549 start_codon:yes stop_codon:yes gene_type:complete